MRQSWVRALVYPSLAEVVESCALLGPGVVEKREGGQWSPEVEGEAPAAAPPPLRPVQGGKGLQGPHTYTWALTAGSNLDSLKGVQAARYSCRQGQGHLMASSLTSACGWRVPFRAALSEPLGL